ncbi:hypothetical protein Vretimale_14661 [Volvox reticuliferus]|uniref:Uncharacterized protein n=1 Tax=Volvox reticuliferus TaxID=1737510 RepID=A0A8J4CVL9_9CHLO|nr:hypothetical protein Vretifemale_15735 [Volvox reticuliferus]GIM11099.1 hypothetical protein Vretimale_14661 [Volvox reticuliferus]
MDCTAVCANPPTQRNPTTNTPTKPPLFPLRTLPATVVANNGECNRTERTASPAVHFLRVQSSANPSSAYHHVCSRSVGRLKGCEYCSEGHWRLLQNERVLGIRSPAMERISPPSDERDTPDERAW